LISSVDGKALYFDIEADWNSDPKDNSELAYIDLLKKVKNAGYTMNSDIVITEFNIGETRGSEKEAKKFKQIQEVISCQIQNCKDLNL
jgi:hypothetical protein